MFKLLHYILILSIVFSSISQSSFVYAGGEETVQNLNDERRENKQNGTTEEAASEVKIPSVTATPNEHPTTDPRCIFCHSDDGEIVKCSGPDATTYHAECRTSLGKGQCPNCTSKSEDFSELSKEELEVLHRVTTQKLEATIQLKPTLLDDEEFIKKLLRNEIDEFQSLSQETLKKFILEKLISTKKYILLRSLMMEFDFSSVVFETLLTTEKEMKALAKYHPIGIALAVSAVASLAFIARLDPTINNKMLLIIPVTLSLTLAARLFFLIETWESTNIKPFIDAPPIHVPGKLKHTSAQADLKTFYTNQISHGHEGFEFLTYLTQEPGALTLYPSNLLLLALIKSWINSGETNSASITNLKNRFVSEFDFKRFASLPEKEQSKWFSAIVISAHELELNDLANLLLIKNPRLKTNPLYKHWKKALGKKSIHKRHKYLSKCDGFLI